MRETLEQTKIASSPIFTLEILQIPLLSTSPLSYPWEVIYQILISPHPRLWEDLFGAVWEAIRKEPIYIGWCYGLVAESGKLKKK